MVYRGPPTTIPGNRKACMMPLIIVVRGTHDVGQGEFFVSFFTSVRKRWRESIYRILLERRVEGSRVGSVTGRDGCRGERWGWGWSGSAAPPRCCCCSPPRERRRPAWGRSGRRCGRSGGSGCQSCSGGSWNQQFWNVNMDTNILKHF